MAPERSSVEGGLEVLRRVRVAPGPVEQDVQSALRSARKRRSTARSTRAMLGLAVAGWVAATAAFLVRTGTPGPAPGIVQLRPGVWMHAGAAVRLRTEPLPNEGVGLGLERGRVTLRAEVPPGTGFELGKPRVRVQTLDLEVVATDALFSVERIDAFTRVAVNRGSVRVLPAEGLPRTVTEGEVYGAAGDEVRQLEAGAVRQALESARPVLEKPFRFDGPSSDRAGHPAQAASGSPPPGGPGPKEDAELARADGDRKGPGARVGAASADFRGRDRSSNRASKDRPDAGGAGRPQRPAGAAHPDPKARPERPALSEVPSLPAEGDGVRVASPPAAAWDRDRGRRKGPFATGAANRPAREGAHRPPADRPAGPRIDDRPERGAQADGGPAGEGLADLHRKARRWQRAGRTRRALDGFAALVQSADPVWAPLGRIEIARIYARMERPKRTARAARAFLEAHPDHVLVPEAEAILCRADPDASRCGPK